MKEESDWKSLCWKFVRRNRRLYVFEQNKLTNWIVEEEKKLIQKAYEEMRDACLNDEEYKELFE